MIRISLPLRQRAHLHQVFRSTPDRKLRDRSQIVLLSRRGRPHQNIARDLAITPRAVQRWLNAYLERGLDGLRPKKAKGGTPKLTTELASVLRQWVLGGPAARGLDRANRTYVELAEYLYQAKGVRVRKSALQVFCHKHGIRPYRPTYRFLRGDPGQQAVARDDLAALKKKRRPVSSSC